MLNISPLVPNIKGTAKNLKLSSTVSWALNKTKKLVQSCSYQLRNISKIRTMLSENRSCFYFFTPCLPAVLLFLCSSFYICDWQNWTYCGTVEAFPTLYVLFYFTFLPFFLSSSNSALLFTTLQTFLIKATKLAMTMHCKACTWPGATVLLSVVLQYRLHEDRDNLHGTTVRK